MYSLQAARLKPERLRVTVKVITPSMRPSARRTMTHMITTASTLAAFLLSVRPSSFASIFFTGGLSRYVKTIPSTRGLITADMNSSTLPVLPARYQMMMPSTNMMRAVFIT